MTETKRYATLETVSLKAEPSPPDSLLDGYYVYTSGNISIGSVYHWQDVPNEWTVLPMVRSNDGTFGGLTTYPTLTQAVSGLIERVNPLPEHYFKGDRHA